MARRDLLIGLAIAVAIVLVLLLAGCGASDEASTTVDAPRNAGPQSEEVLRSKIVTGVGEDFRSGTHAGPRGFGICIRLGMSHALDRATLLRLALRIAPARRGCLSRPRRSPTSPYRSVTLAAGASSSPS